MLLFRKQKLKEEKSLKNGINKLAIWLIAIIALAGILSGLLNSSDRKMNYSELIQEINQGEISDIEISSDKQTVYATEKNADTANKVKEVTIPSLDSFMEEISDNVAEGQITVVQDEESAFVALLSVFSPFVILIIFL